MYKKLLIVLGAALSVHPIQGHAQVRPDSLIVPGVRVGAITRDATEEELREVYGAQNAVAVDVPFGEGSTEPGMVLYPEDPMRTLMILWKDSNGVRVPREVRIRRSTDDTLSLRSVWHTSDGIGLGTTLKELEGLNGGTFTLSGFAWDYQGTVVSWDGGELSHLEQADRRVLLRLYRAGFGDDLEGAEGRPSDHPGMQRLNPVVYYLVVTFQ